MCGFDHATILSPSFHGLRKERLAQWGKSPGGVLPETFGAGVLHASRNLYRLSGFPYPISDLKPWSPARDKLLPHVHGFKKGKWSYRQMLKK